MTAMTAVTATIQLLLDSMKMVLLLPALCCFLWDAIRFLFDSLKEGSLVL